jgi:thioredoxin-related protein
MKKIFLMMVLLGVALAARAEDLAWLTDAAKAQEQAKAEKKLVLLDFTGSDWCGWCIRLHKEVFSKPEFAEYAKKNLVLVEVDFPNKKKLSKEQQEANQALQKKYAVRGYPTIILLDGSGVKVGQLGYDAGVEDFEHADRKTLVAKPATFIAAIEKVKPGR